MIRCTCHPGCPVGEVVGEHVAGAAIERGFLYNSYEAALARQSGTHRNVATSAERGRPAWDEYFLAMANCVATRATCDRKHVGAIIVDKRMRIISTGYNGSAKGQPHCDDEGHLLKEVDGRESCVRTLHAESNALDDAGRRADGGTIYVTVIPCFNCAKRIVNAGITRVIWSELYQSQNTQMVIDFLKDSNVEFSGEESSNGG